MSMVGPFDLYQLTFESLGHLRCHVFDVSPECDGG